MKRGVKIAILYVLGFLLSIAPALTYFFINFDTYVKSTYDGVRLASGGVILCCIVLLKITGKLKIPSAVSVFSMIFVLSYLLDAVLADIMIFSLLALCGELCDMIIQIFIKRERARALNERLASETAKEVTRQLSGRV